MTIFDRIGQVSLSDRKLLERLGLSTGPFPSQGETYLGTVTLAEAETREMGRPRRTYHVPATTVDVFASYVPLVVFWRFVVTRPRDEVEELGGGDWQPVYEPSEVYEVSTGSGSFEEYWPLAEKMAQHCCSVRRVNDPVREAAQVALGRYVEVRDANRGDDLPPVDEAMVRLRDALAEDG